MTKTKSMIILLGLVLCLLCLFTQTGFASSELEKDSSLTITYKNGDEPLANASFDAYRVGSVDAHGFATLDEDFAAYGILFDGGDTSTWRDTATTLNGYLLRDQIKADFSGKTNKEGRLTFNSLDCGLYLVSGETHEQNQVRYIREAFLVQLPAFDGQAWIHDVQVTPKYETEPLPGDGEEESMTVNVLKVWKDSEESQRPKSVIVDLLKDGKVVENVTLNEDNQWRYTWDDLSAEYSWTIVERQCDGYEVKVATDGENFVVTNVKIPEFDEDEPEKEPGSDKDPDSDKEPDEDNESEPGTESGDDEDTLPLTGQPWIIVAGLFAVGLLFVVLGLLCKRGASNDH